MPAPLAALVIRTLGCVAVFGAWLVLCGAAAAAPITINAVEGNGFSGQVAAFSPQCPTASFVSATIAWGDGASSAGTFSQGVVFNNISGSHTYARYGSYSGDVTLNLNCNGTPFQQMASFTATVSDAALSATGDAVTAQPGVSFTAVVAHLSDANPEGVASDETATVAWGDGSSSGGSVTAATGGGFDISGTHSYAQAGSYTITTSAVSSGGSSASATAVATVTAPTPIVTVPTPIVTAPTPIVKASFSTVGGVGPGYVDLNAAASAPAGTTASYYDWTLAAAPGQDVVCPSTEPTVRLQVTSGIGTAVTLTTVDHATGAQTSTTQEIGFPSPAAPHSGGKVTVMGVCSGAGVPFVPPLRSTNLPSNLRPQVAIGGAPPAGCDQDVVFGAVDLRGCLNPIPDPNDIPGGIDLLLAHLLCTAHVKDFCLQTGFVQKSVSSLASLTAAGGSQEKIANVKEVMATLAVPSYYSYSAVRLDGVDIMPQNGSPILIVPAADAIIAPQVRIFIDGHRIVPSTIPLALYLPSSGGELATLTLPRALPLIGSLPFTGSISIALARAHTTLANGDQCQYACAALTVSAELPGVFSQDDGSDGLSATGVVTDDAVNGVQLDSLEIKVPSAQLAGIGISNLDIHYVHSTDSLHAAATVNLTDAIGNISGTIDLVHGDFQDASVAWDAGDGPGIDLGGPFNIYLTHLGGGISLDPTTITATGTITGGPQLLGCSLMSMTGTITTQFGPFSLDANATGQLLCQNVANEYFHIDQSGSILIGGNIDIGLLFFQFSGGLNIAADTSQGHLQADANMSACIDLAGTHCVGAEVVVSDRGIGLCADLGFAHAGGGLQFPDNVIIMWDSCDIGKFRSLGYVTAAGGDREITIPRGQQVSVIGVKGSGAAPRVTLIGPRGQKIDTPADGYEKTATEFIAADDTKSQETYFLIDHMAPGHWKVALDPGSAAVTSIQQGASLPAPHVRGSLTRAGSHSFALHYRLHPLAGQQVTFVERDAHGNTYTIGKAHGAAGSLGFVPSALLGAKRTIVAEVIQDGHPREDDTVLRYRAPSPAPLPAPRGLRARRAAGALQASWHRVSGASGYAVTFKLADHTKRLIQTKSPAATTSGFPAGVGATVQVRAERRSLGLSLGLPATTTVAASKRLRVIKVAPI